MCGCGTDQRDSDRWLVDLNEERDLMDETAFTSRRNSKGPGTGPWGTPEVSRNGFDLNVLRWADQGPARRRVQNQQPGGGGAVHSG